MENTRRDRRKQVGREDGHRRISAAISLEVRRQSRGRFNRGQQEELTQEAWLHLLRTNPDAPLEPEKAIGKVHSAVRHALRSYQAFNHGLPLLAWEQRVRLLRLHYQLAEVGIVCSPEELAEMVNGDDEEEQEGRRRKQGRWITEKHAQELMSLRTAKDHDFSTVPDPAPLPDAGVSLLDVLTALQAIAMHHGRPRMKAFASALVTRLEGTRLGPPETLLRDVAMELFPERTAERHITQLRELLIGFLR